MKQWNRIGLAALFFAASVPSMAQDGLEIDWVRALGDSALIGAQDLDIDGSGSAYVVGNFNGAIDFDPGAGSAVLTSSGTDYYVLKLDSDGDLDWASQLGDAGIIEAVAADPSGNAVVVGSYSGTTDFDPGVGTDNRTPSGTIDAFVWRLDGSGQLDWVATIDGVNPNGVGRASDVAVDAAGNIYVAGDFTTTYDFDPGIGTSSVSATSASISISDYFLLKLDASGNLVWVRTAGTGSDLEATEVALDSSGNPHIGGVFTGSGDLDPGAGTFNVSASSSSDDIFLLKFDTAGSVTWGRAFGNTFGDILNDLAVDGSGRVCSTGSFSGTVDFDPEAGTASEISNGQRDAFVQVLDSGGSLDWAHPIGGAFDDSANSIEADGSGNVYIGGFFTATTDFDPSVGTESLVPVGGADNFTLALDSSGSFTWVRTNAGPGFDDTRGVRVSGTGDVYSIGRFDGVVDFDPTSGSLEFDAGTGSDLYVEKLQPDVTGPSAVSITADVTSPTNADTVSFTIAFDEDVVNFDETDLIVVRTGVTDTGVSVSGGPRSYTAEFSGVAGDGTYTVEVDDTSDVEDLNGNGIASSVTSAALEIDNTPPTLDSITPTPTGPTSANSVDFDFSFSEDVVPANGWDSDFEDDLDGVAVFFVGFFPTGTTPSDAATRTYSGVAGDGTITVSAKTSGEFTDLAGNPLSASPSSVVVVDNTPPEILSITPNTTNPSNADDIDFTVELSEPVTGTIVAFIQFGNAIENGIPPVTLFPGAGGDADTLVYSASSISGDGSFTLRLGNGAAILDFADNAFAGDVDFEMFVDNTGPTIALGSTESGLTNANPIPIQVTLNDDSDSLDAGDFGFTNGSSSGFAGSDDSYTFGIVPGADGAVDVSIAAGAFTDIAGNASLNGDSLSFTYDGTAPVFSALVATPSVAERNEIVSLMFQSSEDLSGNPTVTVEGAAATFVSSSKGGSMPVYEYTFTVPDTAFGGPAEIVIEGTDLAGNSGSLTDSVSLMIDAEEEPASLPVHGLWLLPLAALAGAAALRRRK